MYNVYSIGHIYGHKANHDFRRALRISASWFSPTTPCYNYPIVRLESEKEL